SLSIPMLHANTTPHIPLSLPSHGAADVVLQLPSSLTHSPSQAVVLLQQALASVPSSSQRISDSSAESLASVLASNPRFVIAFGAECHARWLAESQLL